MIGSEIFGTQNVDTEEFIMLVKTSVSNGSDLETAHSDAILIDKLLTTCRLFTLTHGSVNRTRNGHLRKGHSLINELELCLENHMKTP